MKNIKYTNWSTAIFEGFYDSGLYNSDTLFNITENMSDELKNNEYYDFVENGWTDFQNNTAKKITDLLNDYLRGSLIKNLEFIEVSSPRYYNFETDRLVLNVDCDWEGLLKYVEETSPDFDKYLHDNFTSYDGFHSFVPNNKKDFLEALNDDFDRLSQVIIEYYILDRIDDLDEYKLQCYEIANDEIYQHIDITHD